MTNVPRDTVIDVDFNIQTSTSPSASDNDANSIHTSCLSSSSSSTSLNSSQQASSSVTSASVHFDHSLPGTGTLPPECHVFTDLHPVTCNSDQANDLAIVHHQDNQEVPTPGYVLVMSVSFFLS